MTTQLNKGEAANLTKLAPDAKKFILHLGTRGVDENPIQIEFAAFSMRDGRMNSIDDYNNTSSPHGKGPVKVANATSLEVDQERLNTGEYDIVEIWMQASQDGVSVGATANNLPVFSEIELAVIDHLKDTPEEVATYRMLGAAGAAQSVSIRLGNLFKTEEGYWKFLAIGDASDFTLDHIVRLSLPVEPLAA